MKIKKIKPLFNRIITTMDKYEKNRIINGVIQPDTLKGSVKEYQRVVAVGTTVKDIKEGQWVLIDPIRYAKPKHTPNSLQDGVIGDNVTVAYNIPTITLDGKEYLQLFDSDIKAIVTDFEE